MSCVRVVDLKCPACSAEAYDEVVPRDSTRDCPVCLVPMTVYWGAQSERMRHRRMDAYVPIIAGFKRYDTREEWQTYEKLMKKQTGRELEVDGMTSTGRKTQLEEHVQDTINEMKAEGMDYRSFEKHFEKQQAKRHGHT